MSQPKPTIPFPGLTSAQAQEILATEGPNELGENKSHSLLFIILDVVREPMIFLLLACAGLYFFLGEPRDAVVLLLSVVFVMAITLYQEFKTERALEMLKNLSSPRALVIRDGEQKRITGREVVRGDILVLAEGDRVAADCKILSCQNLLVDESMLTGESVAVRKRVFQSGEADSHPGGDDLPYIYAGTLILKGTCWAEVTATGMKTEFGKIGKSLSELKTEKTRLQIEIQKLISRIAVVALSACAILVIIFGLVKHDWTTGFMRGLTLAIAILPEEFPVVLTVFLAIGAWRISKKNVLTRRIPCLEALGSTTILCSDKTGTLTQNSMRLERLYNDKDFLDLDLKQTNKLPEEFHTLLEFSVLASQSDPFDPMEKAIHEAATHTLAGTEHLHDNWKLEKEYALSPELLAMSHVWSAPEKDKYVVAAKGAPEAILDMCHLPENKIAEISQRVTELATAGLRVLGVARAYFQHVPLPKTQHDFVFEFLGLIALADPIREDVPQAIQECRTAGIRVVMITGDYPITAQTIARQITLSDNPQYLTGAQMRETSESVLSQKIQTTDIFARIAPEQKLLLVKEFKKTGAIVAMTGDGVNDAPALKAADIGIAMGKRGTDVARESASLILVNDDFSSIVAAIKMGRRIFENIGKAISYLITIHLPIAGISFFPILFGWPTMLLPIHIVFLELIIDPMCSIVFEAEKSQDDVMKRKPRPINKPLLGKKNILVHVLWGLSILAGIAWICQQALAQGVHETTVRSLAFFTLLAANFFVTFLKRAQAHSLIKTLFQPNLPFWIVSMLTLLLLLISLYEPHTAELFHFAPLGLMDMGKGVLVALLSTVWILFLPKAIARA